MQFGNLRATGGAAAPTRDRDRPPAQRTGGVSGRQTSSGSETARLQPRLSRLFRQSPVIDQREQTIDLYNQGLAICPDDDVAHYELGRALADAGRSAQAEKEFKTALRINPDFAVARSNWKTCARTANAFAVSSSKFICQRSTIENVSGFVVVGDSYRSSTKKISSR